MEVKEHTCADTGLVNHWDQDAGVADLNITRQRAQAKESLLTITESLRATTSTECCLGRYPHRCGGTTRTGIPSEARDRARRAAEAPGIAGRHG